MWHAKHTSRGHGADHVVSRQRPSNPLQLEFADWLDAYGVLDFRKHTSTDEDLSRLGFVAKPRGELETVPVTAKS
jgi:hypothetical protein